MTRAWGPPQLSSDRLRESGGPNEAIWGGLEQSEGAAVPRSCGPSEPSAPRRSGVGSGLHIQVGRVCAVSQP